MGFSLYTVTTLSGIHSATYWDSICFELETIIEILIVENDGSGAYLYYCFLFLIFVPWVSKLAFSRWKIKERMISFRSCLFWCGKKSPTIKLGLEIIIRSE